MSGPLLIVVLALVGIIGGIIGGSMRTHYNLPRTVSYLITITVVLGLWLIVFGVFK